MFQLLFMLPCTLFSSYNCQKWMRNKAFAPKKEKKITQTHYNVHSFILYCPRNLRWHLCRPWQSTLPSLPAHFPISLHFKTQPKQVHRSAICFFSQKPQFHHEFSFPLGRKSMQASGCWVCSRLFSQLAAWTSANGDVRTTSAWKCCFVREGYWWC